MTNANNAHAATDATLPQIFKAMDAHQAQEIPEAYYKAIEGLMTLSEALEIADAQQTPIAAPPASHRALQRGPSPGRDEELPPRKDPLNHKPAEMPRTPRTEARRSSAWSRHSPALAFLWEPSTKYPTIKTSQQGPTSGSVRPPEQDGRTKKLLESEVVAAGRTACSMCVIAQRPTAFTTQEENKPMSRTNARPLQSEPPLNKSHAIPRWTSARTIARWSHG